MTLSELLKEAATTIREYAEETEQPEKTASSPEYFLDMDELRNLANGK